MGVSVKTDGLHECVNEIQKCKKSISKLTKNMQRCRIPSDKYNRNSAMLESMKAGILNYLNIIETKLEKNTREIEKKAEDFESAERSNEASIALIGTLQAINESYSTSAINPNQVEQGSEQETELEENVPNSQVEAVIDLVFGENIDIPDSIKKLVTKAISEINKTKILDGLDEEYANKIRSEIIQDYLDGKLEIEGITTEKIQEYINSEPSIKILLETAISLKSFEKLIESGVITEEQIKTNIEKNLVIQSDEEFEKVYIENGGSESEVKNVNSFYDSETGKMYIRDTVDSKVITSAIVTIMGDIMIYNEETGEVIYNNTQGNLDKEPDANISTPNVNTSTSPTEDLGKVPETNLSGEETNTSTSNKEEIGDKDFTVEMHEDEKNTNDTNINVENIPSNEDINIKDENKKDTSI